MDDFKGLALVIRESNLAGTSAVGRAALEFKFVCLAGCIVGNRLKRIIGISLARVIMSI